MSDGGDWDWGAPLKVRDGLPFAPLTNDDVSLGTKAYALSAVEAATAALRSQVASLTAERDRKTALLDAARAAYDQTLAERDSVAETARGLVALNEKLIAEREAFEMRLRAEVEREYQTGRERDRLRRALDAQNHMVVAAKAVVVELDDRDALPPAECSHIEKWLAVSLDRLRQSVRGLIVET